MALDVTYTAEEFGHAIWLDLQRLFNNIRLAAVGLAGVWLVGRDNFLQCPLHIGAAIMLKHFLRCPYCVSGALQL